MSPNLSNVAGAMYKPNGRTLNLNQPLLLMNAVFGLSCVSSPICQYPAFISKKENHLDPASWSRDRSILGSGWASLIVTSFNPR